MLVRGHPATPVTATFSIHNAGRAPFTVHGLDVSEIGEEWLTHQSVTFVAGTPGDVPGLTPVDEITLSPGEEATVNWSLDMSGAPEAAEGSYREIGALRFRVSWLGVPVTRTLPLTRPLTFAAA